MDEIIAIVVKKIQRTPSILEVILQTPETISYIPGQYLNITVEDPFKRPYSIINSENKEITILVGNGMPGKGSDFFTNCEIGTEVPISSPLGSFRVVDSSAKMIFIAAGSGLAPFISMIKTNSEINPDNQIKLYYGIRNYFEDLTKFYLSNIENLEVIKCLSQSDIVLQNQNDFNERVTQVLEKADLEWKYSDFYICGKNEMIKSINSILIKKESQNIYIENYG